MKTFVNIRGTNGSGKSTLARRFFGEHDAEVVLLPRKTSRSRLVTGRYNPDTQTIVVGNYDTMAGGLDKVGSFEEQFSAIDAALRQPDVERVIAEGILASTVFGSWAEHAKSLGMQGHRVVWAYLTTPIDVCLQRIQARNGGKPIKEELVRSKVDQIDKTRQRAELVRGLKVVQLPFGGEWEALQEALRDEA